MAAGYGFTASGQPPGPFSSPDQVPPGPVSRSGEFATAVAGGDPGNAASSLNQDSARYNLLTPAQFTPTSVLDSLRPSMNGMSAGDYQRVLPGGYTLPTQNGQSASTWQASNYLRMRGEDSL